MIALPFSSFLCIIVSLSSWLIQWKTARKKRYDRVSWSSVFLRTPMSSCKVRAKFWFPLESMASWDWQPQTQHTQQISLTSKESWVYQNSHSRMLYAGEAAGDVWGQAYYSGTPDHTRALLSCWTVPTEHWLKYKCVKQARAVLSMEPHGAAQVGTPMHPAPL